MRDQGEFDYFVWCRANQLAQDRVIKSVERKTCPVKSQRRKKTGIILWTSSDACSRIEWTCYCCFFLLLAHHLLGNNLVLSKELATALMDGQVLQYHFKWSSPQKKDHAALKTCPDFFQSRFFISLSLLIQYVLYVSKQLADWLESRDKWTFPWVHFLYDSLYVLLFLVIGLVKTYLIISFCITLSFHQESLWTPIYYLEG
jgi:uncharacterized membrane protein